MTTQEEENLWNSMLISLKEKGGTRLPTNKSMIIIGDKESGKTTLVAKLQGIDDLTKGIGLEYAYIDIRDEYKEVSMKTPWNIMDQLESWATLLQDYIDSLPIPSEELLEYRQKCIKKWNEYTEENIGEKNGLWEHALGEGVLTRNLGIDVIIVVTMTDYISILEKENDFKDEHFDYIQQSIRKFCLQYGASLFYTSAKEDKNCDLLYKFLTHKIYNFPFKTPALIVEKDAVFIPSGWDSMKKISILYDNLQTIRHDEFYNSVISKVITRKALTKDHEVQAEDEQIFLNKQLGLLNQSAGQQSAIGIPRQDSVMRSLTGVSKPGERRMSLTSQGQGSPTKKIDPVKSNNTATPGEGVLANFFNSLLHKKSNQSPIPTKTTGELSGSKSLSFDHPTDYPTEYPTDAAAELDKLAKKSLNITSSTLNETNNVRGEKSNSTSLMDQSSSDC
ncbi:cytoplasmic dynein 1 light intermediate chain 2 isoform X2 [Daktulosphaira vitifoliae]|uniref:cytoplasmic dynein 1 light intermediate chain 2 isoform X2 n=1 Tax=Daktulosphaira vitifoliae TaxID=58002 RepID=UPI0021AA5364|nr:cytoplasmic dynein 1 light intermediate chain 2 isoform X2 [Daktulosphaira vitifoliae]